MKKKPKAHWIGLAVWFAIVAAAVAACSGGGVTAQRSAASLEPVTGSTVAAQR